MAELSFPFRVDQPGDRTVSADTFARMLAGIFGDTPGVYLAQADGLEVAPTVPAARAVSVPTGGAIVGTALTMHSYANTTPLVVAVPANSAGNPRRDLIVLDLDTANPSRVVSIQRVQGTPAANPVDPALVQTAARYQLPIARLTLADGFATITAAEITDLRVGAGLPSAGAGVTTIVKSADESVSQSQNLQDDDELTFPVGAGKLYEVTLAILGTFNNIGGWRIRPNAPAGATGFLIGGQTIDGGAGMGQLALPLNVTVPNTGNQNPGSSKGVIIWGHGFIYTPTAGDLTIQWAQRTARATATVFAAGSFLRYQEVG